MKKILSILICLILLVGLVACDKDQKKNDTTAVTEINTVEESAANDTTDVIETSNDTDLAAASEDTEILPDTVDPDIDSSTDPNAVG